MADRIAVFGAITLASIASHLADSLYRFVDELPESAWEVRSIIGTLFEIKTFLRELDLQFLDARFSRLSRELLDDVVLGMGSCSSSLKDLDGIVLRCSMTRRGSSPRSSRKSWTEILSSFRNIEGSSLQARLDFHRTFLFNLANFLRNMYSPNRSNKAEKAELAHFQEQIRLLANQQEKTEARMREAAELHRRTVEEQAYHSRYQPTPVPMPQLPLMTSVTPMPPPVSTPPYDSPPRRPYSTPLPSPPFPLPIDSYRYMPTTIHEARPMTPISPTSSNTPISPISLTPPMAPRRYSITPVPPMNRIATPPSTPPMTRPTRQPSRAGNPQLTSKSKSDHWSSQVFEMSRGCTLFSTTRNTSECLGVQMDNLSMAAEEREVLSVKFEPDLRLRVFRNEVTEEAKVVCTKGGNGTSWSPGRRNGYSFQTAINVSKLHITRDGPGIRLMRRNLIWASLYFHDLETLTLFYHSFLALRYHAPSAPVPKNSEYWLEGETLEFSAYIADGGYTHALRLLKDRDSGCIRLAAAKANGEQDVTVWTAFITNQICQSNWMQYGGPKCVKIKNIRQFSFSSCFESNLWRDFELWFLKADDAHAFTQVINSEFRNMAAQRNDYPMNPIAHAIGRENFF